MSDRVPGLDLMRAAAITLVLVNHMAPLLGAAGVEGARDWLAVGALGVDVFFVLSGFLIGGILWETDERLGGSRVLRGFWMSRWMRTLPNYYLFLAANIVLWVAVFHHPMVPWRTLAPYAVFGQNLGSRIDVFFVDSWSLAVEEWFYLLVPAGLFVGLRLGGGFRRVYWTLATSMLGVSIVARATMPEPTSWNRDVAMVVIHKFDALGWGVLAVAASRTWPEIWRRWRWPALAAGVLLIVECWVYEYRTGLMLRFSLLARIAVPALTPLGCALLLPAAAECAALGRGRFERGVGAIARWSYSLYLINFPLSLMINGWFVRHLKLGPGTAALGIGLFVTLGVTLAAANYRWYERLFLRARGKVALCREAAAARGAHAV